MLCIFIAITSVYVCRFITTISYHSVTLIFILYLRLLLSFPHTAWLYMIITLFLCPDERSTEHLSLRKFSPSLSLSLPFFHNFILIHWIFIFHVYKTLYKYTWAHISFCFWLFSLGVLCFCLLCSFLFLFYMAKVLYRMRALWIILFCFEFCAWRRNIVYARLLYRREKAFEDSRSIESFTHQKLLSLGIINWLQFTENFTVSWLYYNFAIYLYLSLLFAPNENTWAYSNEVAQFMN